MANSTDDKADKLCDICGKEFFLEELISASDIHGAVAREIASTTDHWSKDSYICSHDLQRLRHKFLTKNMAIENKELSALQREMLARISDHESILQNLNEQFEKNLSTGDVVADKVAAFGGSWKFIIIFSVAIVLWIGINSIKLLQMKVFDPFPFILLNLVLSCVAALQAPVIMMSQNRQEAKDRMRAEEDFRTNLKAEMEIRTLSAKLDELLTHQWRRMIEIQHLQIEMKEELSHMTREKIVTDKLEKNEEQIEE